MRISISNLAWDISADEQVFGIMRKMGVTALEIAPTKYFPDIMATTEQEARALREKISAAGIHLVAFHALLLGKPELTLFESEEKRNAAAGYLIQVARLAGWLGVTRLIFGSAKNRRVPEGMNADAALAVATDFFRQLVERCREFGVVICMKPGAKEYGCNFCVRSSEAAGLVNAVDHPGFRLHLDSGIMAMNGENPVKVVGSHADIIEYVHASDPKMLPVGSRDDNANHRILAKALLEKGYDGYVSLEMLPPPDGIEGIARSLDFVVKTYGYVEE